ncbi:glycosyltransferase [Neptunomonas sp.]|uniref:glycosyltransferase n=1 Tax=Neptunomonas sp. TaxID=1971898 RepID=UPI0025D7733E|nr:glycosyltransferase [Neptunomonas sp.]
MKPIDVIVPVYRGLQDVKDCLDSVLNSKCNQSYDLIFIDDASPEPEVSAYLQAEAKKGEFTLLINEENLGFVATVNRGMRLHEDRDVILLNSDTQVANDWIDRLVHTAYAKDNTGTVTPFSNNATICSYPNFCQDNELPKNLSVAQIDDLFALCNPEASLDIPTAVGFCMYIRRECLTQLGYFDLETFGMGYGEENDFSQRAISMGWTNQFALDVFVHHTGNVSFGDEHNELKHAALGKITAKHPTYERQVHEHIADDPAKPYRERVWLASLKYSAVPFVVHISHNRGGGTARFVEELSDELSSLANSLLLMPSVAKPGYLSLSQVFTHSEALAPEESGYTLYFHAEEEKAALISFLKSLPVQSLHYHHLIGLPKWFQKLPKKLGLPWFIAVHDYYMACPHISLTSTSGNYCEEKGISDCNKCLSSSIGINEKNIETWRNSFKLFLEGAETCFTPSNDCQQRMEGYFPDATFATVYHQQSQHFSDVGSTGSQNEQAGSARSRVVFKVIVLGALSKIKGADVLEALAVHCKQESIDIEFELMGYSYRDLVSAPNSNLTVSGAYQESELQALLEEKIMHQEADLIWFPAQWPETFSYTLSAAIESGLPILASSIGAFPERLYGRSNAWVLPRDASLELLVNTILAIKKKVFEHSDVESLCEMVGVARFVDSGYRYKNNYLASTATPSIFAIRKDGKDKVGQWVRMFMLHLNSGQTKRDKFRVNLLKLLVRIKFLPIMSSVVQRIPQSLQSQIKTKLLK